MFSVFVFSVVIYLGWFFASFLHLEHLFQIWWSCLYLKERQNRNKNKNKTTEWEFCVFECSSWTTRYYCEVIVWGSYYDAYGWRSAMCQNVVVFLWAHSVLPEVKYSLSFPECRDRSLVFSIVHDKWV